MRKYAIIITLILLNISSISMLAAEKSDKLKPKWLTHSVPTSSTQGCFFVSTYGTGYSLEAARQATLVNLTDKLMTEHGLVINSTLTTTTRNRTTTNSSTGSRETEIVMVAEERDRKVNINCSAIDEYWEYDSGYYKLHLLYYVSDSRAFNGYNRESITVTTKYPGAGFLSLIPSAGQFCKGSIAKGSVILAAEAATIGAALLAENTRATYIAMMHEQPKYAQEYKSFADQWLTTRNLSIGAAAAIYVYNLIDAFAAPGAKRVVVKNSKASVSMVPYADQRSVGAGFSVNF